MNRHGLEVPLFDFFIGMALCEKSNLVGNHGCSDSMNIVLRQYGIKATKSQVCNSSMQTNI
jgi:hypothetical protein